MHSRTLTNHLAPLALCLLLGSVPVSLHAAETEGAHGSISVTGKPTKAAKAALATVSFDDALKAAHVALPGKVVKGVLEDEDGSLQYAFEVLNPKTGAIDEVAIDAGNGKVLSIDRDDKD